MNRFPLLVALLLVAPVAAGAQVSCNVVPKPSTRQTAYQQPGGAYNVFYGGGAIVTRCPARGITLVADSVELYGQERVFLIGNVRYSEPRVNVAADYITYFTADERVVATGRVNATLPSGSRLRGPQAEYRRASPRVRPAAELEALGRPTVTIAPGAVRRSAEAGRDTTATEVTANRLFMRGDTLLYGSGQVVVTRPDLGASGDSIFMNTATEYARLMRSPLIETRSGRPFRLTGFLIDMYSRDRQLERVIARGNARAVSEDLTLVSDTLDFRIEQDLVQAAFAWGKNRRAEAVSETQRIQADSITIIMPQQRLQRVIAQGDAYSEAEPDTLRFRTTEKDWLRGDTIVGRFDTTDAATDSITVDTMVVDTAAAPRTPAGRDTAATQIRELISVGGARSYHHLPPQDSTLRCPAISYLRGDSIRVTFDSGEVRTVRVTGAMSAPGIYAEPDSSCGRPAAAAPGPVPGGVESPPADTSRSRPASPPPAAPARGTSPPAGSPARPSGGRPQLARP